MSTCTNLILRFICRYPMLACRSFPMPNVSTAESRGELLELRRSRRFTLSAPAFFCWMDLDGKMRERPGMTRDVAMAGAFIVADAVPPLHAAVSVDIYCPGSNGRIVELHGEGKVTRVEGSTHTISGFAAEVMFQAKSSDDASVLGPREVQ